MAVEMNAERWKATNAYIHGVFGREDEHLAGLMKRAVAAGLPDIAVNAEVGRLLMLLASLAGPEGGGARLVLELGTLAGYSGIWLARGLGPGGRLVTVEPEPRHAAFAREMFAEAGVSDRVEIIERPALEALPDLAARFGPGAFDMMFFDAIKEEYPAYFTATDPLLRSGGLLVADNVLGGGDWWIDAPEGSNTQRDGADRFNRMVAGDGRYEAACVPLREGILVARKRG